jgi:hypothetical protein
MVLADVAGGLVEFVVGSETAGRFFRQPQDFNSPDKLAEKIFDEIPIRQES